MSRFNTAHPVMVYVLKEEIANIKPFAKSHSKSVSELVREGLQIRMSYQPPVKNIRMLYQNPKRFMTLSSASPRM